MSQAIIIIGSGMAGYAVAREFRKLNSETPLLMITQDDGSAYSKPMLSTGFTKNKDAEALVMSNAVQMSEQLNMSIRTQTSVQSIDTEKQTILVDNETIEYSKLVLATGASPFKLKFVKPESDRILSINDLDDYRAFRTASQGKKHVAIVGTGLIGCEYANDLLNGEYEVSLIGLSQQVLDTMLPPEASKCVAKGLSDAGANFYFERSVVDIQETIDGVIVELDNGEKISADIAISAIGLAPNTKLASESGIETNKGITCDRSLETSAKNVYTLGDCAEVDGMVMLYVLPMMACARALASTLNDEPKLVSYGVMPVAVKTPACPVVVLPASNENGTWDIESDGFNTTALFKSDQGELLGFALTGDATKQKQVLAKQVQAIHPE